ncbi:MAG TPA: class I SAM-dependent methyltransferase [Pyrinomonadaceae bacterium]
MKNLGTTLSTKTYANHGNPAVLAMLDRTCIKILDVGCGSGDNARLSESQNFLREFYGITLSAAECKIASSVMAQCWVDDVETSSLECIEGQAFDAIIFSHVLEHMKDPSLVIAKLLPYLRLGGKLIIAVPNVLVWRQRLQFLLGRFQYDEAGTLDNTHLRFFTYHSADEYLINGNSNLRLLEKTVEGSVPLWFLRHRFLTANLRGWFDRVGCQIFPNLFGGQVVLKAERVS